MQQRQPPHAFPRRRGRHAAGLERAEEFAGALYGVREGEEGERREAEIEGVVWKLQIEAVHDGRVDFSAVSAKEGGVAGQGGAVGGDEVGA